jgi:streptomycin 3"-adenylyltransferase
MIGDIDRNRGSIESGTRNVILTLARIWSTAATGVIRSKDAAAGWVFDRLPEAHRPVLARARAICAGDQAEGWDDIKDHVDPHVDSVVASIRSVRI